MLQDKPVSLPSYAYDRCVSSSNHLDVMKQPEYVVFFKLFYFCSLNSDVASGKETSDGYDSLASVTKGDGKPRKHHRKSARTRSRQEKTSKPKLSMLNVSHGGTSDNWNYSFLISECLLILKCDLCRQRFATLEIKWWNASWRLTITKWWRSNSIWMEMHRRRLPLTWWVQPFTVSRFCVIDWLYFW